MSTTLSKRAENISRFKKERYLLSLSEDSFRDEVIRPLFLRQGLQDGRDLCGPEEEGKDALFISVDQLGIDNIYVVQTKKGSLNLASNASQNVVVAATQLKTALAAPVRMKARHQEYLPAKAILCSSGKINQRARTYIQSAVNDARIVFLDSDELVPAIDEHLPELWLGIDTKISPYLRKIKQALEDAGEDLVLHPASSHQSRLSAATDKMFVRLSVHRTLLRPVKRKGKVEQVPKFEELPVTGLLRKRDRRILILGDAGAGKSTSLRRLAYVLAARGLEAAQDPLIPVVLRAIEVARDDETSLIDLCAEETTRITGTSAPSFSTSDLRDGRLVVLIDALDEVVQGDRRARITEAVLRFSRNYPKCQVFLTTRPYSFVSEMEDFKSFATFRVSPFSFKQAKEMLDKLQTHRSLPANESREIMRRLEQVHGMELNPLLVAVFAATSDYSRRDIPANITELFKKFTETMLGRWDAAKGLAQQYHAPLKDFILTRVAFQMHRDGVTSISKDRFEELVTRELLSRGHRADVAQLLDEMLYRSGLFRVLGDTIEFRHLLLQEFFAGRGIPSDESLEPLVADDWWQRAIVFYFGQNPANAKALHGIRENLATRPSGEVFTATLTLGLALQACYLLEVKDKLDVLVSVIRGLVIAKEDAVREFGRDDRFPLTGFITYYVFGRDGVACDTLKTSSSDVLAALQSDSRNDPDSELSIFWTIIGLTECGEFEEAERLVKKFRPSQPEALLAIHLGCFICQHVRVTSKEQKRVAKRITDRLEGQVGALRSKFLDEFRTELLEIRSGKVAAIEPASGDDDTDA